ncbi:unnamed protein product [Wuchereria bancrofti]|uniref:Uncharacterized protein n=1 Tax=Wuchereria bancrofti TaxID=6293 RepID=A0A3P7E8J0_WUCBA|nr:unnamed protein product [Wuchereria bancrofti]
MAESSGLDISDCVASALTTERGEATRTRLRSFMGSQQSQLLKNRQQQQPGRRRQHCHFHHLLKKRASIRYLQRSSIGFSMNK